MTQHFPEDAFATANASPASAWAFPASSPLASPYAAGLKRALDILLVLAMAPIALPLIALAAALAASDGHAPFFRQTRIGRNGRRFAMLKIRTMVPDAEDRLARHLAQNPQADREWAQTQKLRRDPRITRSGAFLRRSSLDELPQLLNVLAGQMSLVGPRPFLPQQQSLYPGNAYYTLRPGLTGLWQTEARNAAAFAERATYDTKYANNLTLKQDLKILAKTAKTVLKQTGC